MTENTPGRKAAAGDYRLDEQIGFILRRAHQRHTAIFSREISSELTPTQFAALARLYELGECSQNRLGRLVAVDAATIKGVVERLQARGLVETAPDDTDRRRIRVSLTATGQSEARSAISSAITITDKTLEPLSRMERDQLIGLLTRIA